MDLDSQFSAATNGQACVLIRHSAQKKIEAKPNLLKLVMLSWLLAETRSSIQPHPNQPEPTAQQQRRTLEEMPPATSPLSLGMLYPSHSHSVLLHSSSRMNPASAS